MQNRITQEDIESLKQDLKELDELRTYRRECSSLYIEKKQEFIESVRDLTDKLDHVEESIERLENTIRSKSLSIYNRNPEEGKDIYNGIKERDVTEVVYDEYEAYKWCDEHSLFLILNRSGFEKFIRKLDTVNIPTFVNKITTPTITLPTNIKDLEDV